MNRMKRISKRFLALLLVVTVTFMSEVQVLAASGDGNESQSWLLKGALEEEEKQREEARRQASPLYKKLMETKGKTFISESMDPVNSDSLTDEGKDWAQEYKQKVIEEGSMDILDTIKDASEDKIKHLWRGDSDAYWANKNLFSGVAKTIEAFGSFMGVVNAADKFTEALNLQGETVEDQLFELALLTAEFGMAAFSVIGMSLGFPMGLILSLVLDMILDLFREGMLDEILPWKRDPDEQETNQRYKLPDGTNVYKPNIYIYSKEKRDITVTFDEPQLLTTTIPEYTDSWQVTVDEGSRLTDAAGCSYDFLFYESITEPSIFQTESGWKISADMRKEQFEEILFRLGFNEQETDDFTEFWTEKLEQGTDYIMYPQSTELVDFAMSMDISEQPESTERIWFVFVKDDGRQVEAPVGYELTRGGTDCPYYVIEWGGLILSE